MPDEFRHQAPPYMRTAKPGRSVAKHTPKAPARGRHQNNMSVAPIVHTDGKGVRLYFNSHEFRVDARLDGLITN